MRPLVLFAILLSCAPVSLLGEDSSPESKTVACTFQDGKEMSVRYDPNGAPKKDSLPVGELWPASGSPMYLFTQTELSIGDSIVPVGAYGMYVIPGKKNWILVINRAVAAGSSYDQQQDLLRAPMEIGHFSESQPLEVALGHVAPQQCNLRIYFGKTGAWTEFKEK